MRRVADETGYVADPHTAVGLEAARRYRAANAGSEPIVVMATAHPAKFPEAVSAATGETPEAPDRLASVWQMPTSFTAVAAGPDSIVDAIHAG
jgi:threonine synthase